MKTVMIAVLLVFIIAASAGAGVSAADVKGKKPMQTYIHEFPHAPITIHFHPNTQQFKIDNLDYALDCRIHAAEFDVHMRESDGEVVCNHDSATSESPTLRTVLDKIFRKKGKAETVNRDGFQFFIVLEPKENSDRLFEGIARLLQECEDRLSTAVEPGDKARGVTVVITGSYPREFYAHFQKEIIDRLCLAERHDYSGEITDLSENRSPIGWVSIRHSGKPGEDAERVRALHEGKDLSNPGKFNVRIWDCHRDLPIGLESGADSLNCDRDEIVSFQKLLTARSQKSQK